MILLQEPAPYVQKGALKIIIRALQQELDGYDATYALKREILNLQSDIKDKAEEFTKLEKKWKEALTNVEEEKEKVELLEYKLDKLCQALADANKKVAWYKTRMCERAQDYPSNDKFYSLGSTNPWHIRRYLNTITEKP